MLLSEARRFDGTDHFSASAPPITSEISLVICACRARLYWLVKDLIMSWAFSVAAVMATLRAICSLTAASRKHLKSRTLNDVGKISSSKLLASGKNSYSTCCLGAVLAAAVETVLRG